MAADYYTAETEPGDYLDDPSEDAIYDLIGGLKPDTNTFFTIEPAADATAWYASVALHDDGGYEIERRDPIWEEHEIHTDTDPSRIANHLTIWLARRDYPNRPAST